MQMIHSANAVSMSSADLLELVNDARADAGEPKIRANVFADRIKDELDGEHYKSFVVQNLNGTQSEVFELTRDQCALVSMRESKAVRRKVLSKLNALEAKLAQQAAIPTTLSAALRLAADQAEQIEQQAQQLAIAAPKVEFVDRFVVADGLYGFRQVAKMLAAKENELSQWLIDSGIMYRLGGKLTPCAAHLNTGRFEVKAGASDAGHAFTQAKFTAKGFEWIAGKWAVRQLEIAA